MKLLARAFGYVQVDKGIVIDFTNSYNGIVVKGQQYANIAPLLICKYGQVYAKPAHKKEFTMEMPPQNQSPVLPKRSKNYIVAFVSLTILLLLIAIGILAFLFTQTQSTVNMQTTSLAQATATIKAQVTTLSQANSTVKIQGTALSQARATARGQATSIAQERMMNEIIQTTAQAQNIKIAGIPPGFEMTKVHGPIQGNLAHNPNDTLISDKCANVNLRNFIVSVQFTNPYDINENNFDYGIRFGVGYRVVLYKRLLLWREGASDSIVRKDKLDQNLGEGESNNIMLVVKDKAVFVYLNGHLADTIYSQNLPLLGGDVCIGTGFFKGNEIYGEATHYDKFTIWSLK